MPSECVFEFDRPEPIYYGGEVINGRITLKTTSTKTVNEVYIQLTGKAKVRWESNNGSRSKTYHGNEIYLDSRTVVHAEGDLAMGTHTYTFSIPLPEECPSSCETKNGKIRYKVSLVVDRQWQFNNVFKKPITVLRVFNLNLHPELMIPLRQEDTRSFCFWPCKSGLVISTLTVPFGGYAPGQDILYTLDIDNQSYKYDINGCKLLLQQIYHLVADDPSNKTRERINTLIKIKRNEKILRLSKQKLTGTLTIPPIPPTSQNPGIVTVRYAIDVGIDTNDCHKYEKFVLPITIGTIPIMQSMSNPQAANDMMPQSSIETNPPTYEKALNMHNRDVDFMPQYPMYRNPIAPTAPPELSTAPLID